MRGVRCQAAKGTKPPGDGRPERNCGVGHGSKDKVSWCVGESVWLVVIGDDSWGDGRFGWYYLVGTMMAHQLRLHHTGFCIKRQRPQKLCTPNN